MSRSTNTQPTNLLPLSYRAPDGYKDTESEYEPTDTGSDPHESDNNRDRQVRRRHDRRRDQDADSSRLPPTGPSGRNLNDREFSENNPCRGLNPTSLRFIDYNVAETDFLFKSADYLRRSRTLREQYVPEWRQRARCAVRAGEPTLARKLIQQAQLIKMWQDISTTVEDIARGQITSTTFRWFVQHTYERYLRYLAEAARDGVLQRSRKSMLEPWAIFLQWIEDPPNSASSTSTSGNTRRPDDRLEPANRQKDSTISSKYPPTSRKSSGGPQDHEQYTTRDSRSSRPPVTMPVREKRWENDDDDDETLLPSSSQSRPDLRVLESRYERNVTDYRDDRITPKPSAQGTVPPTSSRPQKYEVDPPRSSREITSKDKKKYPQKEHQQDYDDDDDYGDDDSDELKKKGKRTSSAYGYKVGEIDPRARPRIPPSNHPVETRPTQNRGTTNPISTGRSQDSTNVNPQSPSSTVGPVTAPGLSDLMKQFIALKTFQDCRDFCEDNPEILEEDHSPLQSIAVYYLQQGNENSAMRLVQRRLMLRDAISYKKPLEWMRLLPKTPRWQDQLQDNCELVLEAHREVLGLNSTPPRISSGPGTQKRGGSEHDRVNASRSDRQPLGYNTKIPKITR